VGGSASQSPINDDDALLQQALAMSLAESQQSSLPQAAEESGTDERGERVGGPKLTAGMRGKITPAMRGTGRPAGESGHSGHTLGSQRPHFATTGGYSLLGGLTKEKDSPLSSHQPPPHKAGGLASPLAQAALDRTRPSSRELRRENNRGEGDWGGLMFEGHPDVSSSPRRSPRSGSFSGSLGSPKIVKQSLESATEIEAPPPGTSLCSNCKKFIPVGNFNMHELRCAREVQRCPVCQQLVKRTDMEIHKVEV
jgi:hypothetical protein